MTAYRITSKPGADHGVYEGQTPADALAALHNDAGYDVHVGDDGELVFASEDDRDLCGTISDWHIESA